MRMSLVNVEQCCGFACERGSLLRQAGSDDDADTKSVPLALSRLAQIFDSNDNLTAIPLLPMGLLWTLLSV